MTVPLYCVIAFVGWTLLVVGVGIGYPRVSAVLHGRARPNEFPAEVPHGSPLYRRTMRAHANCVENLPLFASVVLVAHAAGVEAPLMDRLAVVYVGARVLQTTLHISSGRNLVINLRFTCFFVQLVCLAGMIGRILV
jgi:uncharacterized MAPEG superfamily protein